MLTEKFTSIAGVAELIEHHEIVAGEAFGDLAGLVLCLFLFERIDERDGREEAELSPVVLDGLDAKGRRDMGFTRSRTADQNGVLGTVEEFAPVKLMHHGPAAFPSGVNENRRICLQSFQKFQPLPVDKIFLRVLISVRSRSFKIPRRSS